MSSICESCASNTRAEIRDRLIYLPRCKVPGTGTNPSVSGVPYYSPSSSFRQMRIDSSRHGIGTHRRRPDHGQQQLRPAERRRPERTVSLSSAPNSLSHRQSSALRTFVGFGDGSVQNMGRFEGYSLEKNPFLLSKANSFIQSGRTALMRPKARQHYR